MIPRSSLYAAVDPVIPCRHVRLIPPEEGDARLTREPLEIVGGQVAVPERPGLGIELDIAQVEAAHTLYREVSGTARDDVVAMRYLVPGWTYDPKRPSFGRG